MIALAWGRRIKFAIWVGRMRAQLARQGVALELDAPEGARLDGFPALRHFAEGDGPGALRLRLGSDVRLGRGMTIEVFTGADNSLEIGDVGRVLDGVRIALRGGSVRFGPKCLVRDGVWIKSAGEFVAGEGVTLSSYTAIHCTGRIELEDLVGLGERVSVIDSDHTFDGTDKHYMRKPLTVSPVRIGRNSMVAFGAVVLRGVTMGPNSVVAANSVVRKGDYPRAAVIAGNPARVIKELDPATKLARER